MAVNWTEDQKKVIESRDRNLLVSAAAGSGKTAVLVERIIRMITEGEHPYQIDQLLVMTFTRAAADEMRERVLAAIDRKLLEDPHNSHLQVQAAMIPYAKITTIDSFCLNVLREHYDKLDIDPAFRVGDEGELLLLRGDVMEKLIEDYYGSGDPDFQVFVDTYASGKTDQIVEDYIYQVYTFSQSNPWPGEWIGRCRRELQSSGEEDLKDLAWMEFLLCDVRLQAGELAAQMEDALAVCEEEQGPAPYIPMVTADIRRLKELGEATDYAGLRDCLAGFTFDRLASVRAKDIDQEKKALVSGCRDRVKKAVGKLKDLYCFETVEEVLSDIQGTGPAAAMLLKLAEEFGVRYQAAKREKNIVDFNDLEHLALEILLTEEDGVRVPSGVADELSSQFEEILVDEYQDSNEVQETLIQSISRERFGKPNVFMVGDVKQSIYKFRLARPELFLEKYENYPKEDGPYQKIELQQNFRSRSQVLDGVNQVFYQIMTKNLGNIRYTEDTALHPGAAFEPCGEAIGKPELLIVHTDSELLKQLDDDSADYTSREIEARMIAAKIRQIIGPDSKTVIWDKEKKAYRPARLGDIVILLRSLSGWAEEFVNVLMNEGIPAYAERRTGYFSTAEVETVLSMVSIIDNPMQDIPLAAVLKSPMAGITDEELALIMARFKKKAKKGQDRGLYGAVTLYLEQEKESGNDTALYRKLSSFWELLTGFRKKAVYLSIHELLYEIYEKTGYYHTVCAMPAGEARRANLDMLVEKASAYEATSYTGLFHFARYIEKLKKYETDFGEASLSGQEDAVRILSIHKSKGLEFPIVFLAGIGKKFNKQDVYGRILIDPDLGIGTDYVDLELRVKAPTLKKNVLRRRMELEALGEELRVLYVAMTRAKEMLVMTGTDRYLDKKLDRYQEIRRVKGQVPFTILSTADSYLDWLLMSLSGKITPDSIQAEDGIDAGYFRVCQLPLSDLVSHEMAKQAKRNLSKELLLSLDLNKTYDEAYGSALTEALEFKYPFAADIGLHTKLSVSEIKKSGQFIDEEESDFLPTIPQFMRSEPAAAAGGGTAVPAGADTAAPAASEPMAFAGGGRPSSVPGGAFRGTAYHRALELLDFASIQDIADVNSALQELAARKRMDEESLSLLNPSIIWNFLNSPLGKRMSQAQAEGRLKKEQQFVMGIPARDMAVCDSDELVLIQGIIDACFIENETWVLVDYKTDHVTQGSEQLLVDRYKVQLDYYQKALEQMTGKKVSEKIIYSLSLQKEIPVDA